MMNVYNSLTRRVEELKPLEGNEIRLYTCGPTVYNFAHIGNFRAYAFAYAFEDILRRVVQFNGMKIRQVMNLTDVDDKTIRGANAAGVALTDYTKTYKDAFFADLKKLNIQPAEVYPAATDHIPEMIARFAARRTNTTRRTSATSRSGKRGRSLTAQLAGIRRGDAVVPAGISSAPRCR